MTLASRAAEQVLEQCAVLAKMSSMANGICRVYLSE